MAKDKFANINSQTLLNEIEELWVEKYRPVDIDDLAASDTIIKYIKNSIAKNSIEHLILYGKPGTGKNSIVNIIKHNLDAEYMVINASEERGIDAIRDKVMGFAMSAAWEDKLKIVILNEADGLNTFAQDSLRELIENSSKTCRFIFTCNYINKIADPIRSRCVELELSPDNYNIAKRLLTIFDSENVEYDDNFIPVLIKKYSTDLRKMINESQRIYGINSKLIAECISITNNKEYFVVFDELLKLTSLPKISNMIKETIFDDDIYTILTDYTVHVLKSRTATLATGEYAWRSRAMADKDMMFLSCILTIQEILEDK